MGDDSWELVENRKQKAEGRMMKDEKGKRRTMNVESGEWMKMEDGRWKMGDGSWKLGVGSW